LLFSNPLKSQFWRLKSTALIDYKIWLKKLYIWVQYRLIIVKIKLIAIQINELIRKNGCHSSKIIVFFATFYNCRIIKKKVIKIINTFKIKANLSLLYAFKLKTISRSESKHRDNIKT
jgi:hypothetical protein